MISIGVVNSASGAAAYYAKDNYYAGPDAESLGQWTGSGAEALGLNGSVDASSFEAVLAGKLPGGAKIATPSGQEHRAGLDLVFSAPKSLSLLALVGGDQRLATALEQSTKATLGWVEANLIEARQFDAKTGQQHPVKTGSMVAATFTHDLSRNRDPQLHVHSVIANATLRPDGLWRAVRNDPLFDRQTTIAAVHNADLRARVEALGYAIVPAKNPAHGQFEIAGVSREAITAFSTRSAEIYAALEAAGRDGSSAEREFAALSTRASKDAGATRDSDRAEWAERAERIGFDPKALVEAARQRSAQPETVWSKLIEQTRGIGAKGVALAAAMGITPKDGDALVPERLGKLDPVSFAAAQAVASAVRELSEHEAAYSRDDILRTALLRHGPFSVAQVEARIDLLRQRGLLIGGEELLTRQQTIDLEQRVIGAAREGVAAAAPIMEGRLLAAKVQEKAAELGLRRLNPGQLGAAVGILSSANRVELVQGGAGVGKSAVLMPVAALAREAGHPTIALAHVGRIAREFGEKTGSPASTVDQFLGKYRRVLDGHASPEQMAEARAALSGSVLLVDEASQIGDARLLRLIQLANRMNVVRLVLAGDINQLPAIEAGKPFANLQKADVSTSGITENLRAKTPQMQALNSALGDRNVARAFEILAPATIEVAPDALAKQAAAMWASLPETDRAATLLLTGGRAMRSALNEAAQHERYTRGETGDATFSLTVLDRVNSTREGARQIRVYAPGRIVEFQTNLTTQQFGHGDRGEVVGIRDNKVELRMADGKIRLFDPDRLPRNLKHDAVAIHQPKAITLHDGDQIRWAQNDHQRGLLNGDTARIDISDDRSVRIITADQREHRLERGDRMLEQLDLGYAANVHISQGLTAKSGILIMSSRERMLNTAQSFLVAVTRIAETVSLVTDNPDRLERDIARNAGGKTAGSEVKQPDFEKERDYQKELTKVIGAEEAHNARLRTWSLGM